MNENEFELDGRTYVARPTHNDCEGCGLHDTDDCWGEERPYCTSTFRTDNRDVIFVEKQL